MKYSEALSLLGLSGRPTSKQAYSAFRRAALKSHPDKTGESGAFVRLTDALHTVLGQHEASFSAPTTSSMDVHEARMAEEQTAEKNAKIIARAVAQRDAMQAKLDALCSSKPPRKKKRRNFTPPATEAVPFRSTSEKRVRAKMMDWIGGGSVVIMTGRCLLYPTKYKNLYPTPPRLVVLVEDSDSPFERLFRSKCAWHPMDVPKDLQDVVYSTPNKACEAFRRAFADESDVRSRLTVNAQKNLMCNDRPAKELKTCVLAKFTVSAASPLL